MATIGAATFSLAGISVVACGAISDRLIRRGADSTFVRKAAFVIGAIGGGTALIACGYSSGAAAEAWLLIAGFLGGCMGANTYVVAQVKAGPLATGRWVRIQNTLANLAGLIAPSLTGVLVQKSGTFVIAFAIAGAMAFCSGAAWVLFTGRYEPIDWTKRRLALRGNNVSYRSA
jgi:MFS family permease